MGILESTSEPMECRTYWFGMEQALGSFISPQDDKEKTIFMKISFRGAISLSLETDESRWGPDLEI